MIFVLCIYMYVRNKTLKKYQCVIQCQSPQEHDEIVGNSIEVVASPGIRDYLELTQDARGEWASNINICVEHPSQQFYENLP